MDIHWHLCSSTRVPAKHLLPLLWKCQPGAGKWNVNLSNMGRSTIKHHVGGGGRGGGGGGAFWPKPPVGGLIASEGQRWLSQPCAFRTAGVCWRLINCCQRGWQRSLWLAALAPANQMENKSTAGWKQHWSAPLAFHSLIWLNDAEAQPKLSLDTDLTRASTVRPETLQPVAFNFLPCVAKQHLDWCLIFTHVLNLCSFFFTALTTVTSSSATSGSNYCILELTELPSPD